MKNSILKRGFSCFLSIVMLVAMLPMTVMAAETDKTTSADTTTSVEIVSFLRGSQTDLRSSELLEARVTGYDGNVQELTYEWKNELGTYLYVYNSHNMYNIENTNGEIEIYNNNVGTSANMSGRSYKDTFSGTGYCWASVYGANVTDNYALDGTISVTVKDKDGNVIGTDSHTGDVTTSTFFIFVSYSYSGFIPYDLDEDMNDTTIGIFEGETQNVKDLLGESAIVHITCVASTVSEAEVTSGGDLITLTENNGEYYIEGVKAGSSIEATGDAQIKLSVKKDNCKFHYNSSGESTTTVFVFKKPTTSTTTTTLTLAADSLDDRCRYFIKGVEGTKQDDGTILFTGLTPNTEYEVEVRGEYTDNDGNTQYAYAYVYDTTLPVYTGTVKVYLNGTYDTSTATATGTLVNIEDMINNDGKLYVKKIGGTEFVTLEPTSTGVYSAVVENGTYYLYYAPNDNSRLDEQVLVMESANRTRYVFFNSVTYKDGDTTIDTEYYLTGSSVDIRSDIPTKDGSIFTGWKENDTVYQPSADLTEQIAEAHTLTAQWANTADVYVNITLNHKTENGANNDSSKHNIAYELMQREANTGGEYTDVAQKTITWNGSTNVTVDGYDCAYDEENDVTTYTATSPTFTNVLANMDYTLETAKSGYSVESITQATDENGNIIITAVLIYNPNDFDFTFDVELDEEAKTLPTEYKPVAVNVKVTSWYTPEGSTAGWHPIQQHEDTHIKVDIDSTTGKGTGTYPVWTVIGDEDNSLYKYRIEVVSYVLPDGTIMPANDVNNEHTTYSTDDERYKANIIVTNGKDPVGNDESDLTGAYYQDNAQQGSVKAVISILTHKVTFEPNGGKFSDGTTENKSVEKQIAIPDLTGYTPTRDGGYVFAGWYVVNENNEITNETVNSGDALYNDITLRAKWNAPLTVEGQVAISGTYKIDGIPYSIHDVDRAKSAVVLLQKILPNGYSESIKTVTVTVTYAEDDTVGTVGKGTYKFTEVPDDGSEYRILVLESNYSTVYQNEPESLTLADKYTDSSYNISQYMAEFGTNDPTVATVNAFLHFDPTTFALNYEIDSTLIGEGFRPTTVETLVLYDDGLKGNNPQNWAVISQMVQNGVYYGQDTRLTDGKGKNYYPVWTTKPDGQTLYDYALLLNQYTINGTETGFTESTAPFKAIYNGTARYDSTTGNQTQLLTIKLQPKIFAVNFEINFTQSESDYVTNMDNYNLGTGYATAHTWSYDTDISNVQPHRAGYKFLGWYENANGTGNPVTNIDASVAENVTLYAKWEKSFTVTFHSNNEAIADDIFRTYYENGAVLPEDDNNMSLSGNNTVSSFYDIPEFNYETHNKYVFKGWYLDEDNNNDSRPINWNTVYTTDTDVYAHWIEVGTVAQEASDTKNLIGTDSSYPGYDLIGVQIRDVVKDNITHYGEANTGLRFLTVLSEDVYTQINDLNSTDNSNAEYGYVLAKTTTAQHYADGNTGYELQYKDSNVNGVDTTTDYSYVMNVKCSGVPDHFNGESYRIYTAVITYTGLTGEALENAHQSELVARSYIRYYDANGLYRTYYNNYTGTNTYSGCSTSFSKIQAMANSNN